MSHIEIIPNFPKEGINFYNISPILQNQRLLNSCIEKWIENVEKLGITHVLSLGARGFLFGPLLAQKLKCANVIARKEGELPPPITVIKNSVEYRENSTLAIRTNDIPPQSRVLIVDDVLATGAKLKTYISYQNIGQKPIKLIDC